MDPTQMPFLDVPRLVKLYGEALRAQNDMAAKLCEAAVVAAADAESAILKFQAVAALADEAAGIAFSKQS